MTQIGEQIAIDVMAQTKPDCWYCKKEPGPETRNKLEEDPPSTGGIVDNVPENDLKNQSSTLGGALGRRPKWKIAVPHKPSARCGVVPAAHHLIPGNASLKRATGLHKYMREDKNLITNDIGYDVNGKANGVWLPGSYGVRPGSTHFTTKWSKYKQQNRYAWNAMKEADAQFHDAHPKYSRNVLKTLRSIATKLAKKPKSKCPVCGAVAKKERPPYGLVGRLNFVSGQHRQMVTQPAKKAKYINAGYFTSKRSKLAALKKAP